LQRALFGVSEREIEELPGLIWATSQDYWASQLLDQSCPPEWARFRVVRVSGRFGAEAGCARSDRVRSSTGTTCGVTGPIDLRGWHRRAGFQSGICTELPPTKSRDCPPNMAGLVGRGGMMAQGGMARPDEMDTDQGAGSAGGIHPALAVAVLGTQQTENNELSGGEDDKEVGLPGPLLSSSSFAPAVGRD
jgi:hypothetical protein